MWTLQQIKIKEITKRLRGSNKIDINSFNNIIFNFIVN
jgi:hypothetical protein